MKKSTRDTILHWAEVIDALRIFPRAFLSACFTGVVWLTAYLVDWYCHLPHEQRSLEASGFGAVALASSFAFLRLVYRTYSEGGRDWNAVPQSATTSTVVATKTTTPAET